jgi:riboflavin kinase/FMN adenylyltransferase
MEPVIVSGSIVKGLQHGRTLGYPTINIAYEGALMARPGVYAARVRVDSGDEFQGAAIVGGDFVVSDCPKFEVHLLEDTKAERYGEMVIVELVAFASEIIRMSDMDALKEKIENDIVLIRKMF